MDRRWRKVNEAERQVGNKEEEEEEAEEIRIATTRLTVSLVHDPPIFTIVLF